MVARSLREVMIEWAEACERGEPSGDNVSVGMSPEQVVADAVRADLYRPAEEDYETATFL